MRQEVMDLKAQLTGMFTQMTQSIVEYTPRLIGAIIILAIGWIIAHLLRVATKALLARFDPMIKRVMQTGAAAYDSDNQKTYAGILGRLVFWIVILFFLTAATNFLGWQMASNWMSSLMGYLPNLISGLFIIFLGFLLGNVVKEAVYRAAQAAQMGQAEMISQLVRIMVLLTAFIIGVEQAGIEVAFISSVLTVIIAASFAGAAFAFSLGGKNLAANLLGAQYASKHCDIGKNVRIGDQEGRLVEVTHTSIILDGPNGRVIIPAKEFQDQVTTIK